MRFSFCFVSVVVSLVCRDWKMLRVLFYICCESNVVSFVLVFRAYGWVCVLG